jgi:hypothetical protein
MKAGRQSTRPALAGDLRQVLAAQPVVEGGHWGSPLWRPGRLLLLGSA